MNIHFSVDVTPFPQPRPRVVNRHAFEPKRITDYKNAIKTIAKIHMRGLEPCKNLVQVSLTFRRNRRLGSHTFGDIDNLVKAVLDALNGICYLDDALVVKLVAHKDSDSNEGVDISVTDVFEGVRLPCLSH